MNVRTILTCFTLTFTLILWDSGHRSFWIHEQERQSSVGLVFCMAWLTLVWTTPSDNWSSDVSWFALGHHCQTNRSDPELFKNVALKGEVSSDCPSRCMRKVPAELGWCSDQRSAMTVEKVIGKRWWQMHVNWCLKGLMFDLFLT